MQKTNFHVKPTKTEVTSVICTRPACRRNHSFADQFMEQVLAISYQDSIKTLHKVIYQVNTEKLNKYIHVYPAHKISPRTSSFYQMYCQTRESGTCALSLKLQHKHLHTSALRSTKLKVKHIR